MDDRTGVVLAAAEDGGFGDRFPPLVPFGDDPMVCHVVDTLATVTTAVVLTCPPDRRQALATALGDRQVRVASSSDPPGGSLARFGRALDVVETPTVALVAATMPLVDPGFLRFLFERIGGNDAAVPRLPDGDRQPLQAVYRTGPAREAAAEAVVRGGGFAGMVDRLQAMELSPTEVQQIARWRTLQSVRSPEAIEALSRAGE